MSTQVQVSVEEYLRASYPDLDREFVRGEIVERGISTWGHARLQAFVGATFVPLEERHRLFAATGLRVRLAPDVVRVADVCVFREACPKPHEVASIPPYVVAEILSPDDRFSAVLEKCEEYRAFGIEHIWLLDPEHRRMSVYVDGDLRRVLVLTLPGYPVQIEDSLFDRL